MCINVYIGYSSALFFVIFRAPDLSLTQIVVETVTTALFLLVLYFLPRWESRNTPRYESRQKLVIAVSVGVVFTLVALSVKSGKLFTSISAYFEDRSEEHTSELQSRGHLVCRLLLEK